MDFRTVSPNLEMSTFPYLNNDKERKPLFPVMSLVIPPTPKLGLEITPKMGIITPGSTESYAQSGYAVLRVVEKTDSKKFFGNNELSLRDYRSAIDEPLFSFSIENNHIKLISESETFTAHLAKPTICLPIPSRYVQESETALPIFFQWHQDPIESEKVRQEISKGQRGIYQKDEIEPAIRKFENEFNCSWSLIKQAFKKGRVTIQEMQIVQDLRSAYNFYVLKVVTEHFRKQELHFQAYDTGSPTLGSDADFGLDVQRSNESSLDEDTMQAKQAEAIIQFNMEYERIWGHPSSVVFDTNAYSKQYVRSIQDSQVKEANSIYQANASLLMKLRLSPRTWEKYVQDVVEKIKLVGREQGKTSNEIAVAVGKKMKEFQEIYQLYQKLENALLVKIIEVACVPRSKNSSKIEKWQKFIKDLKAAIESSPSTRQNVVQLVSAIKAHNPDIEIWASNLLHEDSERRCAFLEKVRFTLLKSFAEFRKETNALKICMLFNRVIGQITKAFKTSEDSDEEAMQINYRSYLQRMKKIPLIDGEQLKSTFKNIAELQEQKTQIQKELKNLAALIVLRDKEQFLNQKVMELQQVYQQNTVYDAETGIEFVKDKPNCNQRELILMVDQIKEEIENLKKQLVDIKTSRKKCCDVIGREISAENYEKVYEQMEVRLAEINSRTSQLYQNYMADKVSALFEMADHILFDVQKCTSLGQYYAQESLVSIGAYAYVVINIQQKSSEVRSLSQYSQAFNEVMGYYENHQEHQNTAFDKIIEASKYGERGMLALGDISLKASRLGIKQPNFAADLAAIPSNRSSQEKMYRLQRFFNETLFVRKGVIGNRAMEQSEKYERLQNASRRLGILPRGRQFSDEVLISLNRTMDALTSTLEAWRSWVPVTVQSY